MTVAEKLEAVRNHSGAWSLLGKKVGAHRDTVYKFAKSHGIASTWAPSPSGLADSIKELIEAGGLTYSQIGKKLGVTKNVVVGHADRLGLTKKRADSPAPSPLPPAPPSRGLITIPDDPALPGSKPVPLADLTGCKWPVVGGFCNNPMHGPAYCLEHDQKSRPRGSLHPAILMEKMPFSTKDKRVKSLMNQLVKEGLVLYNILPDGRYRYFQKRTPPA